MQRGQFLYKKQYLSSLDTNPSILARHGIYHDSEQPLNQMSFKEVEERTNRIISSISSQGASAEGATKILMDDDVFDTLEAWMEKSKAGYGLNACQRAQYLLDALEANLHDPNRRTFFVPAESFYNVVLHAYAVSNGKRQASEAAQTLLERMLTRCRGHSSSRDRVAFFVPPEPSIKTFNIVINCWAKSGVEDSGIQAEKVVQLIDSWREECNHALQSDPLYPFHGCRANEWTLTSLINALCQSKSTAAPEKALELLAEAMNTSGTMEDNDRFSHVQLNSAVFNSVLQAWAKSGRGQEGALQAENVLKLFMEWSQNQHRTDETEFRPTARTYSIVLDAWARCEQMDGTGLAASRANEVLESMVKMYCDGRFNDLHAISFSTCISAWARCRNKQDAPEKAEGVLQMLIDLYKETDDNKLKPSIRVGNAVLAAWAAAVDRSDSMNRAFSFLDKMKLLTGVDLVSYKTILDGLAKRGMGKEATDLIHWLEEASKDGNKEIAPDTEAYNSVLIALTKHGSANGMNAARSLFHSMEESSNMKPNAHSFTILIDAYARSSEVDKAVKAKTLLTEMIDRYERGEKSLKPDIFAFVVTLKACAQTNGSRDEKMDALRLAREVFQSIHMFSTPNHMAFSTLMVAINRLAPNTVIRNNLLQDTFERCCEAGYFSHQVNVSLTLGAPHLLPSDHRLWNKEWSRKVPAKDKPRINFSSKN